jgi:hypothetical protein
MLHPSAGISFSRDAPLAQALPPGLTAQLNLPVASSPTPSSGRCGCQRGAGGSPRPSFNGRCGHTRGRRGCPWPLGRRHACVGHHRRQRHGAEEGTGHKVPPARPPAGAPHRRKLHPAPHRLAYPGRRPLLLCILESRTMPGFQRRCGVGGEERSTRCRLGGEVVGAAMSPALWASSRTSSARAVLPHLRSGNSDILIGVGQGAQIHAVEPMCLYGCLSCSRPQAATDVSRCRHTHAMAADLEEFRGRDLKEDPTEEV